MWAYDCGSNSSVTSITRSIDNLIKNGVDHIDFLVISHFDRDHVNSIKHLLNKIKVRKALVPAIPTDMRIVYNEATNGAYDDIIAIFDEYNMEVTPVVDEYTYTTSIVGMVSKEHDYPSRLGKTSIFTSNTQSGYYKVG